MIRLLHIDTLEFKEFNQQPPPYATTSHRWQDGEEVTKSDIEEGKNRSKRGFAKVQGFCAAIRRLYELSPDAQPRVEWLWIDTCCIDKANFTELSEAITSMFRFYADSSFCLAYLHDVGPMSLTPLDIDEQLYNSEWWSRGWTLQELLAPKLVVLYNSQWEPVGHKSGDEQLPAFNTYAVGRSLNLGIEAATGIPRYVLSDFAKAEDLDIEIKKSWMKDRVTTRPEDRAYCQLGIFNLFIPLIYGERGRAMVRLEAMLEIIQLNKEESNKGKDAANSGKATSAIMYRTPSSHREQSTVLPKSPTVLETASLEAAESGYASIVAKLIKTGAVNIDARGFIDQETALHKAAANGRLDVVKILIEAGATVNSKDRMNFTPLHEAVDKREIDVTDVLITAGADVNAHSINRMVPLDYVGVGDEHTRIRNILLGAGARTEPKCLRPSDDIGSEYAFHSRDRIQHGKRSSPSFPFLRGQGQPRSAKS